MESTHAYERRLMDLNDTAILIGFGVQCGIVLASVAYLKAMFADLKRTVNGLPTKVGKLETNYENLHENHNELNDDFKEFRDDLGKRVARLETAAVK